MGLAGPEREKCKNQILDMVSVWIVLTDFTSKFCSFWTHFYSTEHGAVGVSLGYVSYGYVIEKGFSYRFSKHLTKFAQLRWCKIGINSCTIC